MKVIIPKAESEGTFEGWVRVDEDATRIYDKMLRIQREQNKVDRPWGSFKVRCSFLIHLTDEGRSSHWIALKHNTGKELIDKHLAKTIKYRNCAMKPFVYMKCDKYSISVWPRHERDDTLTKENNWGEEE